MPNITQWQQRIRRAEQLANQHAYAKEVLSFYVHLARFQQEFQERLARAGVVAAESAASALQTVHVISSFPQFLAVVAASGPERVSLVARDLRSASAESWTELLNSVWHEVSEPLSAPEQFLAFAFLQPYAELLRLRSGLRLEHYTHPVCPFCNRKPGLGVLRPLGDGAQRKMFCGFCLAEWEFRRIVCPGCGEENHAKLPVYTAETIPHIRVECCDSCHTYIKTIDLAKNGLADPLVDELASLPLDLWAQERGYTKLRPNLLGM